MHAILTIFPNFKYALVSLHISKLQQKKKKKKESIFLDELPILSHILKLSWCFWEARRKQGFMTCQRVSNFILCVVLGFDFLNKTKQKTCVCVCMPAFWQNYSEEGLEVFLLLCR